MKRDPSTRREVWHVLGSKRLASFWNSTFTYSLASFGPNSFTSSNAISTTTFSFSALLGITSKVGSVGWLSNDMVKVTALLRSPMGWMHTPAGMKMGMLL